MSLLLYSQSASTSLNWLEEEARIRIVVGTLNALVGVSSPPLGVKQALDEVSVGLMLDVDARVRAYPAAF